MPTSIDFDVFSEGQAVVAADIDGNFAKINTYLSNGIPNADLDNKYHNICISIPFGDMTSGSNKIYGFSVPTSFSEGGLVFNEINTTRGGDPSGSNLGALAVRLYTSYADAFASTTANAKYTVSFGDDVAGGTMDAGQAALVFDPGQKLFVRADVTTNNALDVTVQLWFKAQHRS
tara:strand:+ start:1085 stop:1609 length:525 start_codon:yes stop_codon:yes gene_type:complete